MQKKQGFTLIELLVVISIIALLSTFAVVGLGSARKKGRDAKRLADVKQLQTALEFYFSDNNSYPAPAAPVTLGAGAGSILCDTTANANGFAAIADDCSADSIYMAQVPANPTPGGIPYVYTPTGAPLGSTYELSFQLESDTGNITGGVAAKATPSGITQ